MFVDLIKFFSEKPNFQQVVLDNYQLGNGLYIIVENNYIKTIINVNKEQPECIEYEWLRAADYYSQLVDMNKSVDPSKKIHSCNPFSIFIKADTLPEYGTGEKVLTMDGLVQAIEKYYSILSSIGKEDKKALEILKNANLPELDNNLLEACKSWLLENLDSILQVVKDNPPTNGSYLKIFFYQDIIKYENECRRYLLPKIFNKNDYNTEEDGKICGLSNFNMGLNAKKPYLELMSTQFEVPFRISIDNSIVLKCFFEWITDYKTSDGKSISSMYLSTNENNEFSFSKDLNKFIQGYFIHFKRGKETWITDFDYLPFNPDDKPFFRMEDVLGIENWRYNDLYSIWQLEKIIDGVFFANRLVQNYLIDTSDMKSYYKPGEYTKNLENLMLRYRKALHNYFRKGDNKAFNYCVDVMSKSVVLEILKMDEENGYWKTATAFNLRIALIEQMDLKGDEKMADFIQELTDLVRTKRDSEVEQPHCDTDREFFFVCGQLSRYLFSLSEAAEPKHSFAESLIKSKDSAVLKRKLKDLYITYGHNILLKSMRFNNLMSMVIGYSTDVMLKEYEDYFLAGFLSKNLLYEKKEKQEVTKNENE